MDAVKNELIQLIDVKQRQKVCLTPVDSKNQLLKKKPEKWDDIKNGRFMIINGQHSITASKSFNKAGAGKSDVRNFKRGTLSLCGRLILQNCGTFQSSTT